MSEGIASDVPLSNRDDVGAWNALGRILAPDEQGNTVVGRHVGCDSHGCVVYGTTRPIGTIGLRDLVVVETPEGILVCHQSGPRR